MEDKDRIVTLWLFGKLHKASDVYLFPCIQFHACTKLYFSYILIYCHLSHCVN